MTAMVFAEIALWEQGACLGVPYKEVQDIHGADYLTVMAAGWSSGGKLESYLPPSSCALLVWLGKGVIALSG